VEVSDDNVDTIDKLRNIDNKTFAAIYPFPERGVIGLLLSETDNFKMALAASNTNEVFTITEAPATPIGGYKEFYNYIATFLRYPAEARQLGVEGKVFVQFIVNKEGYLTDVQAVKGIGAGCDKEAVNIVSASPRWKPATQKGIAVNQKIVLPITFNINGLSSSAKAAQPKTVTSPPNPDENGVYTMVDEPAMPIGGYKAFYEFINSSIQYPSSAKENKVQGKVYVRFIVSEDGSLTDVEVISGIGNGCDEEAKKAVSAAPSWNSARHEGESVKQKIVLPVSFSLPEE